MSTPTRTYTPWLPRVKFLSSLHRLAGIVVVLPVLLLVTTGLPLQFTEQLQLGKAGVGVNWLHASYGIAAPADLLVGPGATQIGGVLLLDERVLDSDFMGAGALVGGARHDAAATIAFANAVLLVPHDASIQIEVSTPPHSILRFASNAAGDLIIDTAQGAFISDDLGTSWQAFTAEEVSWQTIARVAADPASRARYRASKLSWERVLLDLHSGRVFGPVGEWVMNLASFVLILLALTGVTMWVSGPKR